MSDTKPCPETCPLCEVPVDGWSSMAAHLWHSHGLNHLKCECGANHTIRQMVAHLQSAPDLAAHLRGEYQQEAKPEQPADELPTREEFNQHIESMVCYLRGQANKLHEWYVRARIERNAANMKRDAMRAELDQEITKRGKLANKFAALKRGTAATVRKLREARATAAELEADCLATEKLLLLAVTSNDETHKELVRSRAELDTLRAELIEARANGRPWWRVWG